MQTCIPTQNKIMCVHGEVVHFCFSMKTYFIISTEFTRNIVTLNGITRRNFNVFNIKGSNHNFIYLIPDFIAVVFEKKLLAGIV